MVDEVEIKVISVMAGMLLIAFGVAVNIHIVLGNLTGNRSFQLFFASVVIGMFLFCGGLLYGWKP